MRTYTITTNNRKNKFNDRVSIDDAVPYQFDFTPWQEDFGTITGVTVVAERGLVGVTNIENNNGLVSAVLTFSDQGKALVTFLVTTATAKKKVWLEVYAKDYENEPDDYGFAEYD
jgi:hypothetical protein